MGRIGPVRLIVLIAVMLLSGRAHAQFPAACDKDKECVGHAITIKVTSGKLRQYVEIPATYYDLDTAITFDAWIAPNPQPGKRQFIASLWGPEKGTPDANNQWVLYLEDNQIVFKVHPANVYKGDAGNTIAQKSVPDLYSRGWCHIAAVWDGKTTAARLYLDGVLLDSEVNNTVPCRHLNRVQNSQLYMLIGSANSLDDDSLKFRTFFGQIDEIRLWSRGLSAQEVSCFRLRSLIGNEPGLEMYYRCNEGGFADLCDATGHGHVGSPRSGASCDTSLRQIPLTYTSTPSALAATLVCTQDTDYTITLTDTSACGDRVTLSAYGQDAGLFKISPSTIDLSQGAPSTVTVHMHSDLIGAVSAGIAIANANSCGEPLYVPLNITRKTELSYSLGRLLLDTVYVGCQNATYSEATLTICNPSPRTVTITRISLDSNHFTWSSPGLTFPKQLPNGGCITITVRMNMLDSTKTLLDTLRVLSDEDCAGSGVIPIYGRVQDVLGILQGGGKTPLVSQNFGEVCPGFLSNTQTFNYRDLAGDTVYVDSIIYSPANFFGAGIQVPMKLAPKRAYQPTYNRFKPFVPGPVNGTMRVTAFYHGCHIAKEIALTGKGYSVDVDFLTSQVNFGNVTIGKTATQTADVHDSGVDARSIDAYLRMGDVFSITGGRVMKLSPKQTLPVTLQFRPRQVQTYYDTLCIFDEGCYETKCIPVQGTGFFNAFSFNPPYLDLQNVIGCGSAQGSIIMTNVANQTLTIAGCTLTDPTGKFQLLNPIPNGPFAANALYTFNILYTPNDLANDRADEVYIDITLSDGQVYHIIVRASSVAPKLYVTPLTTFGVVEAGWSEPDSILIENASTLPEKITNITLPYGYKLLRTDPPYPLTLGPRDSMWLHVEFDPTGDSDYNASFTVQVDSPCSLSYTGMLKGRGTAVKLQVPVSFMNYGLVKPCDCISREVALPNNSNFVPITIDSVWVDGFGVTPASPSTFRWKWKSTNDQSLPKTLGAQSADTLLISFCPDIPATKANLVKTDTLHIAAHSQGWTTQFRTVVSGRREMNFQPNVSLVQFPATRVDTSAQPQTVLLTVPDITVNPDGDYIRIDSVTFEPDQKVFSAHDSMGGNPPWTIQRNQKFKIRVGFFPRAPKVYTARMHIHTSHPCGGYDSTVLVTGSGFAPAYGLQLALRDTALIGRDTIHLSTCDTLVLLNVTSRDVPIEPMDLSYHLGFDTTELKAIGGSSRFSGSVTVTDTSDGANVIIHAGKSVTAGVIDTLRFAVIGGPKIFPITLDNPDFESDSLVFFKIVAGNDRGYIAIDQPAVSVTKQANFDTVRVKDCDSETIVLHNTGPIPVRLDSISGLPQWHSVIAPSTPFGTVLQPGDSALVTIQFCPRDEATFDTSLSINTSVAWAGHSACFAFDTSHLQGVGYAPPYPFKLQLRPSITAIDSIGGRIADTIEVPIFIDTSVPLTPLDMRFSLAYNTRALEYLSTTSIYGTADTAFDRDSLKFSLLRSESVAKGEIARVKFLVTVPDSVVSTMTISPGKFTSDSIMFIKPRPVGDTTRIHVAPRCNISRLVFRNGRNAISAPQPNPTRDETSVDISLLAPSTPELRLLNAMGQQVMSLLPGDREFDGGSYHISFDTRTLPQGAYVLDYRVGDYHTIKRIVVVR